MPNSAPSSITSWLPQSGQQLALREWLWLSFLLLLCTAGLASFNGLGRLDQTLYDQGLQTQIKPARDDIIIVAIDDYSLTELGKWPWPRAQHAALLQQLNAAKPLAIGVDILFSEKEINIGGQAPNGDQQLADTIANSKNLILPLVSHSAGRGLLPSLPLASLVKEAKGLGHIHLELDRDGVNRSIFLREGMNGQWWPHFALALHDAGKNITRDEAQINALPGARSKNPTGGATPMNTWQRDFQMYIPYYGSSGHFSSVPYVAVLRGEVPTDFFRDKYVLIGPTAIGMADAYTTPVTSNQGAISGVEINANILASLLDGRSITVVPTWITAITCCIIVLLSMLSLLLLSPRAALTTTLGIFLGTLAMCYVLLLKGWWLPPAAALIILLLTYPLWSWRRLEAAINFLGKEFTLLDQEPHLLPEQTTEAMNHNVDGNRMVQHVIHDKLERHIIAMHTAVNRVRDLRQFVSDSLYSLPDATMVTSIDGNILLSNPAAVRYFTSLGLPHIQDALLPYLFAKMSEPQTQDASQIESFSWWHLLDVEHTALLSKGVEVQDPKGRDLLVKSAPCYSAKKNLVGWIISLIDISDIRQAERGRDETLYFISHDMRAPQASILALLELQQGTATALPQPEFISRIEKASRITLGLADNFVQLAQAESNDYRFEHVDFQEILIDAIEEMWALAKSKGIQITRNIPEDDYAIWADRSLMTRVLTNLLSNAIKYSPNNTYITCSLAYASNQLTDSIICKIQDQGYGIARADQSKLFQRFQRFQHGKAIKNDGVGLGMVFIKKVMDRHHGRITFTSAPSEGSCFQLSLAAYNH